MFLWIITALAVIGIDQLTKYLTVTYLKPLGSVPLWQDVLHLTYVENTGAAFGMLGTPVPSDCVGRRHSGYGGIYGIHLRRTSLAAAVGRQGMIGEHRQHDRP